MVLLFKYKLCSITVINEDAKLVINKKNNCHPAKCSSAKTYEKIRNYHEALLRSLVKLIRSRSYIPGPRKKSRESFTTLIHKADEIFAGVTFFINNLENVAWV